MAKLTNESVRASIEKDFTNPIESYGASVERKTEIEKNRDEFLCKYFIGKWCIFSSIENDQSSQKHCGEITFVEPIRKWKRIPNYRLTIKGRTGKIAKVKIVEQYAQTYKTRNEALNELKDEYREYN